MFSYFNLITNSANIAAIIQIVNLFKVFHHILIKKMFNIYGIPVRNLRK
jgi:hypothetical protein